MMIFNPAKPYKVTPIKVGENIGKFKICQKRRNHWFNIWILCQKK